MDERIRALESQLALLPSFAIAFSGGVDSTFLLAVAKKAAKNKVLAISVDSQFVPQKEIELAKQLAKDFRVEHFCLKVDILSNKDVLQNTSQRCYFCKKEIFSHIEKFAREKGIDTLLHGINTDDLKDFRPGLKAAEELGFLTPLADAGFSKSDIRELSRQMDLVTWDKPSQSCLVTRIPYHDVINVEKLIRIEKAEKILHDLGFEQVRVRTHGEMARVEVDARLIDRVMERWMRQALSRAFRDIGFKTICIDIDGYKTGKMNNEILTGQSGTDICHPS